MISTALPSAKGYIRQKEKMVHLTTGNCINKVTNHSPSADGVVEVVNHQFGHPIHLEKTNRILSHKVVLASNEVLKNKRLRMSFRYPQHTEVRTS